MKEMQRGKEEVKISEFVDVVILYIRDFRDSTRKL